MNLSSRIPEYIQSRQQTNARNWMIFLEKITMTPRSSSKVMFYSCLNSCLHVYVWNTKVCISGSCEDMRHDFVDIFVGRHPKCSHLAEGYGAFLSWKNWGR